ncbi:MAG: ABC transporter ATP-binding protein [Lachnospiraceae bacterium]|nr:ABC transporter ATP-binding protein [Lachnospiraceae bacterium]
MKTVLEVTDLTKVFGGLEAVKDVNITVKEREIHALIGPNGAGKTTTLSMINGTLAPTAGRIVFRGEDITGLAPHKVALKGMGRTFQNIKQFGTLTVLENLMVGGMSQNNKGGVLHMLLHTKETREMEHRVREKAEYIADEIGMYGLKDEYAENLPYGRQKVLELGRAMMSDPALILLDEPAAGLNPSERAEFVEILQKVYGKGIDLFLIEHNMDVVMNISHRITVLNFGRKIAEGTPSEVANNDDVIEAYLGDRFAKNKKKEGVG